MIVGIEASNIRSGGGLTHLRYLLEATSPIKYNIEQIVVWGCSATLTALPDRSWLRKLSNRSLNGGALLRFWWQRYRLDSELTREGIDILLVPGGTYLGGFSPFVPISQNLLPFCPKERRRYGHRWMRYRLLLLRWSQARTFRSAQACIFLNRVSQGIVERELGYNVQKTRVVPHGVGKEFLRAGVNVEASLERPFRWLYVSIVDVYKHQSKVAKAVQMLRESGADVRLDLVGPAYAPSGVELKNTLCEIDPAGSFIRYHGAVPHDKLALVYAEADGFIFASSCENMPNVLVEAMSSGLPIVCSNVPPMPDVLKDGGIYCNPESAVSIAESMMMMMNSGSLRKECSRRAVAIAQGFSWERCADETFEFLAEVWRDYSIEKRKA